MADRIPQSTSYLLIFKAYLSSDHVTEATGKTIAITISKNGGAFGNPNVGATNATAVASGWYKVTLDTTDTGTLGPLAVRGAEGTIDDVGVALFVVDANTGGYGYLDAAVTSKILHTPAARWASVTGDVTVGTNNDKTGYSLTVTPPTADQNADALLDRSDGIETSRTLRQGLRLILAALAGKLSGAATTTVTIRDTNDGINRIVATVDADGNRSAVTLDAS